MKIADAEQFVRARCEPAVAGVGLALGTVPVATREEGDGTMAASGALIQMAAQRCRAAVLDGPEHSELLPAQMGLISPDEVVARCTDDVGHLQGGRLHLFFFSRERLACWVVLVTVRLSKGLATPSRCAGTDAGTRRRVASAAPAAYLKRARVRRPA